MDKTTKRDTTVSQQSYAQIFSAIIEQTQWRTRQDINSWRAAIMAAENIDWPQRLYLYNLYDEICLDGHIEGITGQRRDALLAEKFKLLDIDGEPVSKEISSMFNNEWFYEFMKLALESIWWGHSLIQLWDPIPFEGYRIVQLVPRRHVVPEKGGVSVLQGDNVDLIPYRQAPYADWLVEIGAPRDHGLFKIAAPDFIIKKNAKLQWSQYTEIFGMPLRIGYTPSRQQRDIKVMADNLKAMGSAAYGVFQDGEKIEFVESKIASGQDVYDRLIERSNSELSKLILRSTMTIDDGSSHSQGQVHERVVDVLKEADKRLMLFTVKKLIEKMVKHNLVPEGTCFEWNVTPDLESLWNKVSAALQYYDVDLDWAKKTFGIPLIQKQDGVQSA